MKNKFFSLAALTTVFGLFFLPVLVGRATIVPSDLLHQLQLPFAVGVSQIRVHNHYLNDTLVEVYPHWTFYHECLHHGWWPVWNPYVSAGYPMFGVSTYGLANPVSAICGLLPLPTGFDIRIFLQFWLAGVFMWVLLCSWGLRASACFLGALAYSLNSQFLYNFWNANVGGFVWAPLALLYFDRALFDGRWANRLLAGLFTGIVVLSGSAQTAAIAFLLLGSYAAGSWIGRWRELPLGRAAVVLTLTIAVALLASAVQWLPFLEFLQCDTTKKVAAQLQQRSIIATLRTLPGLITFAIPNLWGGHESFDLFRIVNTGGAEIQSYIGAIGFVMALLAVVSWREPRAKALAISCCLIIVLPFVVPPVKQLLYYRVFIAYVFSSSALAAVGLNQLLGGEIAYTRRVRLALMAFSVLLALVAVGILMVQVAYAIWTEPLTRLTEQVVMQRRYESTFGFATNWLQSRIVAFWEHYRLTNPAIGIPLLANALAVAVLQRVLKRGLQRWVVPAILAMSVIDLVTMTARVVPRIDQTMYPLYPARPETDYLRQAAIRVHRTPAAAKRMYVANGLVPYRIRSLTGGGSLQAQGFRPLLEESGNGLNAKALALGSVSHILAMPDESLADPNFNLVHDGMIRIFKNDAALPRAYFTSAYVAVSNIQQCISVMLERDWKANPLPLIETTTPAVTETVRTATAPVPAAIVSEAPTKVRVAVTADSAGFLVLTDTFYPGWHVYVDGKAQVIRRANGAYRAVYLNEGSHDVRFEYEPASIRFGAFVTGLTLLGCVVALIMLRWSRG
jgi:hypothetical protein